jgi:hypothetical protein
MVIDLSEVLEALHREELQLIEGRVIIGIRFSEDLSQTGEPSCPL